MVTGIVGIRQYEVAFTGQANHAGTTRMADRQDAGAALVRFAGHVHERLPEVAGPETVWTIGRLSVEPGAPSVIPGAAGLTLQVRDPERRILDAVQQRVMQIGETFRHQPVRIALRQTRDIPPTTMDDRVQDALRQAAQEVSPGRWLSLHSAAGHDAMILADLLPTGMVFIPSIGGISHDYAENSSEADIVLGAKVFAAGAFRAAARLAE